MSGIYGSTYHSNAEFLNTVVWFEAIPSLTVIFTLHIHLVYAVLPTWRQLTLRTIFLLFQHHGMTEACLLMDLTTAVLCTAIYIHTSRPPDSTSLMCRIDVITFLFVCIVVRAFDFHPVTRYFFQVE